MRLHEKVLNLVQEIFLSASGCMEGKVYSLTSQLMHWSLFVLYEGSVSSGELLECNLEKICMDRNSPYSSISACHICISSISLISQTKFPRLFNYSNNVI